MIRLLLVTLVVLSASVAEVRSDDNARAKALFRKADLHFNIGEFDRALGLYREVYKLKPHPALIYNIAQCFRYLGRWREAVFHYERYLARSEERTHREPVKKLIAECRAEAERAEAAQRTVAPASAPAAVTAPVPSRNRAFDRGGRGSSALLWSGVGLSAAALTVGLITGIVANDRNQEYKDPATPVDRRQELKDNGQPLAVGSVVSLALGGALAVGTALYYWLAFRQPSRDAPVAHPVPGGATAALRLSW